MTHPADLPLRVSLAAAIETYRATRMGGYAPATLKAHVGLLARFAAWVETNVARDATLDALDYVQMARYMDTLRPPARTAATFNNYRQYLVQFFNHCRAEGWITVDPLRYITTARITSRSRLQLTAVECLAMLTDADPRDRIALALGINTGLRAGDIMRLRVGDVDLESGYLAARIGKTCSEDRLPITADLREELARWLRHYAAATGKTVATLPNHWTLVPPARGAAVNVHDLSLGFWVAYKTEARYTHPEEIVHRALRRLGYPTRGEGFHTLRRTCARLTHSLAVADGSVDPIRIAQALLGHQRQATTERYLGLNVERGERDRLLRGRTLLRPGR